MHALLLVVSGLGKAHQGQNRFHRSAQPLVGQFNGFVENTVPNNGDPFHSVRPQKPLAVRNKHSLGGSHRRFEGIANTPLSIKRHGTG